MENVERFQIHAQLEQMYKKYQGVGNADTSREEWMNDIRRDTLASHLASHSRLLYFAAASGKSVARIRAEFLDRLSSNSP
jgi:splicing factor 3B subunit 5